MWLCWSGHVDPLVIVCLRWSDSAGVLLLVWCACMIFVCSWWVRDVLVLGCTYVLVLVWLCRSGCARVLVWLCSCACDRVVVCVRVVCSCRLCVCVCVCVCGCTRSGGACVPALVWLFAYA